MRKNPLSSGNCCVFEEMFCFLHCFSTNCEMLSVLSKLRDDVEMLLMYLSTTSSVKENQLITNQNKHKPHMFTWRRENMFSKCLIQCNDGKKRQKEFQSKCPYTCSDHCWHSSHFISDEYFTSDITCAVHNNHRSPTHPFCQSALPRLGTPVLSHRFPCLPEHQHQYS